MKFFLVQLQGQIYKDSNVQDQQCVVCLILCYYQLWGSHTAKRANDKQSGERPSHPVPSKG